MSETAATILEQIHGLPRTEREAVFHALAAEMRGKAHARSGVKPRAPRGGWLQNRMAELENIYGRQPRPSAGDVLGDLRADHI